ncbi:MAG: low specificity L-threonine aldolase [Candidatus Mcinerneyibacterium aminivorans]|uniref:Low specificity L-threonine aldolase n=1 Tax=Candidatus Mcinerneyibacterium aminivorans TaxID=2703815 RepID=A0A5D0MIM1_9BACT|nr:MAG: low specificity L-threonine aldolase [Candidatus Mcinerneyibacterium aminivorans]
MPKRSFASDNNSGVDKKILKAIEKANQSDHIAYGDDPFTERAIKKFKNILGNNIDVYFVLTGTGANVIGLKNVVRSFNTIFCSDLAHINVDETGAVENNIGCNLQTVPTEDGKIYPEQLKKFMHVKGVQHHSQPKAISISQTTELGTVYTPEEIKNLADFAHENDMYLHIDGARISNAAASLNCNFKKITRDAGVDILSFGGTKNGMLCGEAVIFFDKELSKNCKYIRKESLNLFSKMRYLSTQFIEFLSHDLWYKNAKNANEMAQYLKKKLSEFDDIEIVQEVQANAIFAKIPKNKIKPLQKEHFFYIWDEEKGVVRWMCSFETTEENVDNFVKILKRHLN